MVVWVYCFIDNFYRSENISIQKVRHVCWGGGKEQPSVTKYHEASSRVTGNGCLKAQILMERADYSSRRTSHSSSCGRSNGNLWIGFRFWAGVLHGSLLPTHTDVGICKHHLLVEPSTACVLLVIGEFLLRFGSVRSLRRCKEVGGGGMRSLQTEWGLNKLWTPFNLLPKEVRQGLRLPAGREGGTETDRQFEHHAGLQEIMCPGETQTLPQG